MIKKIVFPAVFFVFMAVISGCGNKNSGQQDNNQNLKNYPAKGDGGNNTCEEFSADFIYSATGKTVVKVEPDWAMPMLACRYYFTYDEKFYKNADGIPALPGGLHIFMMLENLSVARQKEANKMMGLTIKNDTRIKMENDVVYRKDGSLYDLRLIINPNRYVRMSSNKGVTDEELISFAVKVAEKIWGNISFNIKKNPINLEEKTRAEMGASQQAVATEFFNKLSALNVNDALKMMDANENTKQMWQTNFDTIRSLKINMAEEAFKEEWTPTRQTFKVELDVRVSPAGEQMGWSNGKNFRWITLKKSEAGVWLVSEIANNP